MRTAMMSVTKAAIFVMTADDGGGGGGGNDDSDDDPIIISDRTSSRLDEVTEQFSTVSLHYPEVHYVLLPSDYGRMATTSPPLTNNCWIDS